VKIDVIGQEDVETIAYECAYLVSKGWKRINYFEDDTVEVYEKLRRDSYRNDYVPLNEVPSYVWVKPGAKRKVYKNRSYGDDVWLTWFTREGAMEHEG